ncbi:NACHT domain-containing protein [Micromonospora tulbaghiae]|uniref:NACHT domain-containing protein n=1 Tax=Micromonospora tulbaghiae TaxID=479978 RepID=UPI0036C3E2A2
MGDAVTVVAAVVGVAVSVWGLAFGTRPLVELVSSPLRRRRRLAWVSGQYLEWVLTQAQVLQLRGLVPGSAHKLRLPLVSVYVPTVTADPDANGRPAVRTSPTTGVLTRDDAPLMPISRLLGPRSRLLVVGEAGLGKTTFLRYLAFTLAQGALSESLKTVNEKLGTDWKKLPVPVYVPLRDVALIVSRQLAEHPTADASHLLLRAVVELQGRDDSDSSTWTWLTEQLDAGACVLEFDGLDEIVHPKDRVLIDEAVENFCSRYPNNVYIVTARPESLQNMDYFVASWPKVEIELLRSEQVRQFASNWYVAISRAGGLAADLEVENEVTDLLRVINADSHIRSLARSPLFLTVIAVLHYSRVLLPNRRTELYDYCTLALLGEWDTAKPGIAAKSIRWYVDQDNLSATSRRLQLEYVAEHLHEVGATSEQLTKVARHLARSSPKFAGMEEPAAVESAVSFLRATALRGGTLRISERERLSFSYRIIEDYLAARRLARDGDLYRSWLRRAANPRWHETLRLAAGILSATDPERSEEVIRGTLHDAVGLSAPKAALLAGLCLVDCDRTSISGALQDEVCARLDTVHGDGDIDDRIVAGEVLGWLGRLGHAASFLPLHAAPDASGPRVELGVFPVTNAQFGEFIAAGGYRERQVWTTAGWAWRSANDIVQPFFWDEPRFRVPSQPVVGVSWYEAVAYARWTGNRLPTVSEWEQAADGTSLDDLVRAHGVQSVANVSEGGVGRTSPVGTYHRSVGRHGHHDLFGNVWEWTLSTYTPGRAAVDRVADLDTEAARILKGGSWHGPLDDARPSVRRWLHPGGRQFNFGFRLAREEHG